MKLRTIFIIALVLFSQKNITANESNSQELAPWQAVAGKHYRLLNSNLPQNKGITFYFWSGSASCYQLEQALQDWQQQHPDITVERIPLVARPQWRLLAKAWLVAKEMGGNLTFLNKLYETIHGKAEAINEFSDLEQFILTQQIDLLNFKSLFNSLSINQQLQFLENQAKKFPITGVPTIIINNHWYIDASTEITSAQIIMIIDQLLLEDTPENIISAETGKP